MPRRIRQPNLLLQSYVVDQLVGGLLAEGMAGGELAPGEFAVQSVVGALGPVTPSELAQMLGMPATTLSHHLRRFHERGHLERIPNPRDGRSYLVSLTARGEAAVAEGRGSLERTLAELADQLGADEAAVLAEALATFERALRAVQAGRAARRSAERAAVADRRN